MKLDGKNKHKFWYVIEIIGTDMFFLEDLGEGCWYGKIKKIEALVT